MSEPFDITETDVRVLKLLKNVNGGHLRMKFYDGMTDVPAIIPYAEKAPVILWALEQHDRRTMGKVFRSVKGKDLTLAEAMRLLGVNPGLRRLDCSYSKMGNKEACQALVKLNRVDPRVIANCVNALTTPRHAWGWIQNCRAWFCNYRRFEPTSAQDEWFVQLATGDERLRVSHLVDYLANGGNWDRLWTRENVDRALDRWDAERHAEAAAKQIMEAEKLSRRVDYAPLMESWADAGFAFKALDTPALIVAEGKIMRHCVASYWKDVVYGKCRLYSVEGPDSKDRATLELRQTDGKRWARVQLKSHCNAAPTDATRAASDRFAIEMLKRATP